MALSTSSFKERSAFLFALAAGIVLAVALFCAAHPDAQYTQKRVDEKFWQNKVYGHRHEGFNVIISGDSRVYRGISPASMQGILPGAHILNFGFSSGGHNPTVFKAIDNLLAADGLRVVVLGITPFSLTPKAQMNDAYLNYLKKGPTPWDADLQDFFRPVTLKRLKKMLHQKPQASNEIYTYLDDGWVRSDYMIRNPEDALPSYQNIFDGNTVSDDVINTLMRQVKAWRTQGIQVVAYRPPTAPVMTQLENNKSGFNESRFRQAFTAAGGVWIALKDRFETYDGSHLTPESAENLSRILARAIAERTAQPLH